jgi:hypothetical protein
MNLLLKYVTTSLQRGQAVLVLPHKYKLPINRLSARYWHHHDRYRRRRRRRRCRYRCSHHLKELALRYSRNPGSAKAKLKPSQAAVTSM